VCLGRTVFAQNQRFYSIFGPREPHYRCIKDCDFGEVLGGGDVGDHKFKRSSIFSGDLEDNYGEETVAF